MRVRGPADGPAVVCVNGGQAAAVEGTWSASLEWLVGRLAPRFPQLRFGEVKYRIKSWNHFDSCLEDARAAIERVDAERTLLLGFSMGGAVAISVADDPRVEGVLGLAPWIPDRLSVEPLRGRRLDVLHGSLDRSAPGHPRRLARQLARAASNARRRSASRAPTRCSAARCTRSRSARGVQCRFRGRGTWARHVATHLDAFVKAR